MKIRWSILLIPSLALGQGFTIEQVLSSPFPSELVAAERGQRVAWVFDAQGRRNIWVAEGRQFQARQLTQYNADDGQEITDLQFTADGRWIICVRGGWKNQSGEVPNPVHEPGGPTQAVHAVSFEDGRVRLLGEGNAPVVSPAGDRVVFSRGNQLWVVAAAEDAKPRQLFTGRGWNGSAAWSPDGRLLAFVSRRSDHSFIGIFDTVRNELRYIAPTVDSDDEPRWSPDGRRIAFIRQPARGNQPFMLRDWVPRPYAIMVADLASGAAREIWRSENTLAGSLPYMEGPNLLQWAADDRLVFASEQDGWQHLYSIPADGGKPILLTPGACEFEDATLTPDRRAIIYSSNCGDIDRRHLWRVRVAEGQPEPVTGGESIEWSPAVTGDGASLVFLGSDARQPAMPRVMPVAGGPSRMLAAAELPPDFPSSKLVVPQQVVFKSTDGLEIHGQLFLPPQGGQNLPAVLFLHGGPVRQMLLGWHYRYYYHNAYGFNQYLASRGYAVLSVNFRLGIGYGREFRMAPKSGGRGAAEYQDVVAAAYYLRSRPDINRARIGLWGGSYGGYLTAMGLARNSDLFAAGVDLHGVHDWSLRMAAGADADLRKLAENSSPVSAVSSWRSPVLLIHGDDDRNVAFSQTVDLVRRLREQKVDFEQLVYPDEVHDFLLHRHWLEVYTAAARFFDRRLRPAETKQGLGP
jgi:dipeptidyl aminopeptidase/acylaminoacyl peptidase